MKKQTFFYILLLIPISLLAQKENKPLVQFSGIVFDADSSYAIPYVTATNISYQNRATIANHNGYFSFVVREGDTIEITAIGYSTKKLTVPKNLSDHKHTVMLKLKQEVQFLNAVKVYPWANIEEFQKEFLDMHIADDDYSIAKKNTSRAYLQVMLLNLPRDGKEQMSMFYQTEHYNQLYRNGVAPTNGLLNPFAWAAFIDQISRGDQSRRRSSSQED